MTEWEVFGVVAGLATFCIAIVTSIIKLNTTITKLSQIVEQMSNDLRELTERTARLTRGSTMNSKKRTSACRITRRGSRSWSGRKRGTDAARLAV